MYRRWVTCRKSHKTTNTSPRERHTPKRILPPPPKNTIKKGGKASFSSIDLEGEQSAQSEIKKCKEHLSRRLLCRTRLSATSPSLSFSPSVKPLLPLRSVSIHIRHGSIEGKQRLFFLFVGLRLKQCAWYIPCKQQREAKPVKYLGRGILQWSPEVKRIDSLFREFAIFACDLHFIECESWRKWKNLCRQNIVYLLPQRMNSEKTHTEQSERSTDKAGKAL